MSLAVVEGVQGEQKVASAARLRTDRGDWPGTCSPLALRFQVVAWPLLGLQQAPLSFDASCSHTLAPPPPHPHHPSATPLQVGILFVDSKRMRSLLQDATVQMVEDMKGVSLCARGNACMRVGVWVVGVCVRA